MQQRSVLPWLMIVGGGAVAAYFAFGRDASKASDATVAAPKWRVVAQNGWKTPADIEADLIRAENYGRPLTMQFLMRPASSVSDVKSEVGFHGQLVHYGNDAEGRFFDVATFNEVPNGPKLGTVYRLRVDNINGVDMSLSSPAIPSTANFPFVGDKTPVNLADPILRYDGKTWAKKYDASKWTTYLLASKKPVTAAEYRAMSRDLPKTSSMFVKTAARLKANASIKGPIVAEVLKAFLDAPEPYVLGYVILEGLVGDPEASVHHELIYVPLSHVYQISSTVAPTLSSDETKLA